MRVSIYLFLTVFAASSVPASGQAARAVRAERITAPIRDRGTYHVATGTWTTAAQASFSSDVLFNNSSRTGYYFPTTSVWDTVDEGRIPSPSSRPIVGNSQTYTIDCYRIAYCSEDPTTVDQMTVFLENYAPCSDVDTPGANPIAGFLATGLPAGSPSGVMACWIVAFDLANTTGTFTLAGDADGVWDDDPNTDSFGWLGSYPSASPANRTGPVAAGNCLMGAGQSSPAQGFGTKFAGVPGATDATGLGTSDFFWIDANDGGVLTPNANGGCFFFGGCTTFSNPWAGFWLQLFGTKDDFATAYCSSSVNESGGAALLAASGVNPNEDLVLTSAPVPDTAGQFFYGTMRLGGSTSLGDGLRCVGGFTTRMLPGITAGMMMQLPNSATLAVNYAAPYAAGQTGVA